MKKFKLAVCILLALVLTVSGCAFLKVVQDKVCNPPAGVMALINSAAPVVAAIIAAAVPGSAVYVAAVANQQTITAIQAGVCVSLTQLNNLIDFLQSPEVQQAQLKMMAGKKAAAPINVQPLVDWRDKSKK